MRIAVVTPVMKSGERGGAEALYEGFLRALRGRGLAADQVEVVIDESTFDAVLESYERCRALDLSPYDLVVSTKAPTYMVRHPNHVSYLLHTIRVFYDMFEFEFGAGTPQLHQQRALIHALDKYGLHPDRIRRHLANGAQTFTRLYEADPFWRTVPFRALHHPPALEGYREPRPGRYVLLPGRLHRWKRAELVVRAFRQVRGDARLLISGTGEDEGRVREAAAGDDRIDFLGRVSEADLPALYAEAAVVPFVPVYEDYGLITVEAFLAQKPVITCTDSGEPTHFVKDGDNGFVVAPDPQALAERIEYCLHHPDHAAEMGRHGRQAVAHISWDTIIDAVLGVEAAHELRGSLFAGPGGISAPRTLAADEAVRVAVLDMQPIDPPVGGGRVRLLGLYHGLGAGLSATYVGTYDWPGEKHRRHRLSPGLEEVDVPLTDRLFRESEEMKRRAGGTNVIDVAFPLLAPHAPEFVSEARRAAADADVVVFSHPWIYPLVQDVLRRRPQLVVYDSQNVEGYLRATFLDDGGFGTELVRHVVEWEYGLCHAADLVLACSHEDRSLFHRLYDVPFARTTVVPNGTFTSRLAPADADGRRAAKARLGLEGRTVAVFLGSAYGPNVEAARFLISKLAPWLPQVTFAICGGVGAALEAGVLDAAGPNVRVTGALREAQKADYLAAADLALNPMFSGSGTNVKMLDYLAAGLPVVATPVGARGIGQGGEEAFLVCEPADFERGVRRLAEDPAYAQSLAEAGRRLAEGRYSWERISASLGQLLRRRWQTLGQPAPFFSVVVATYERHGHLDELMAALEGQTWRDFEIIVIDQSAAPWPNNDRHPQLDLLYVHTEAKGAVRSRNAGAALARGEVIAFTDDDCRPFSDWLQNARGHFTDPGVLGVEGLIISDKRDDPSYRAVTNVDFEGIGFMTANLLVRREAFMALDGFDLQFDHPHFREDTDLGWRALGLGRIPFGHDVRVYHPPHRRDVEREGTAARNRFFEKDALLLKKHPARYQDLFLREGHYKHNPGFRENFLRGLEKYGVRADDFYLSLLGAAPPPAAASKPKTGATMSQTDKRFDSLTESFKALLAAGRVDPNRQLNPADGFFVYRLLLGRNPDDNGELTELITSRRTFREFMDALLASPEYRYSSGIFPAGRLLMAEPEGFRFWFNSSDREMGVPMALGMYEPRCVALVKRLLRPGMRCLDLGAQTGFYTCLMASLVGGDGHVHAFEPLPASYDLLLRNLRENRFEDRVTAHALAASDAAGELQGSLVSNMFVAGEVAGGAPLTIRRAAVDDVVLGPVDFVKMDIEGHEPAALRGMRRIVAEHRPVVLTEANEYWLRTCARTSARAYAESLAGLGYTVYDADRPETPLDPASLNPDVLDSLDLVALPARSGPPPVEREQLLATAG